MTYSSMRIAQAHLMNFVADIIFKLVEISGHYNSSDSPQFKMFCRRIGLKPTRLRKIMSGCARKVTLEEIATIFHKCGVNIQDTVIQYRGLVSHDAKDHN